MTGPHATTVWCTVLVEELHHCGVSQVCVAPGSRSTPLVLALHRHGGFRMRVFLDERSAAFFALGVGKATGRPCAVVTTSGTAVANLLPAVVEAHQAEVPLLLLTADRPHHLRDADANQAIRQPGIFGEATREAWDLPQPDDDETSLRHLRAVAARAVAAAVGDPPGPVHVNLPFRKPLEPAPGWEEALEAGEAEGRIGLRGRGDGPVVRIPRRRAACGEEELEAVRRLLASAVKPILVAGPATHPSESGEAAIRLAAAWGIPLLADPLSGARTPPRQGAARIVSYDLLLRDPAVRERLRPDLVIRTGWAPTSAGLNRWLESMADVPQVVVDGGGRWKDHVNAATLYLRADPERTLMELARTAEGPAPASWREAWEAADRAALDAALAAPGPRHEGHVAARVVEGTPAGCAIFVSSSMPIRDVDGFGGGREDGTPIHGNRGASGIDGIVSTAAGVSAGTGRRTVALVGDLALLHDANGLLALREEDVELTLVVVNNDGGGIFHMLPVRELEPPFTRFFATPHGLDLAHLARMHAIPHRRVADLDGLDGVLQEALASPGSAMIEIVTEREPNRMGHEAAFAAATAAAREALDNFTE